MEYRPNSSLQTHIGKYLNLAYLKYQLITDNFNLLEQEIQKFEFQGSLILFHLYFKRMCLVSRMKTKAQNFQSNFGMVMKKC